VTHTPSPFFCIAATPPPPVFLFARLECSFSLSLSASAKPGLVVGYP